MAEVVLCQGRITHRFGYRVQQVAHLFIPASVYRVSKGDWSMYFSQARWELLGLDEDEVFQPYIQAMYEYAMWSRT